MKLLTKIKLGVVSVASTGLGAMSAMATPILENDALEGLSIYGTNIGDFLGNLAPGMAKFLFTLGIIVAVLSVIVGAILIAKRFMGKGLVR